MTLKDANWDIANKQKSQGEANERPVHAAFVNKLECLSTQFLYLIIMSGKCSVLSRFPQTVYLEKLSFII